MNRLRPILVVVVLSLLAFAPAAGAASRVDIIRDCEDDSKLSGSYTTGELRDAKNNIPSDKDAYSDCRDVLSAALAAAARQRAAERSGGAGGAGGAAGIPGAPGGALPGDAEPPPPPISTMPGAAPPQVSPEERKTLDEARAKLPEVDVRGQKIVPGVGVAGDPAGATIPESLIVVLALLALTALAAALPYVRRRVGTRRPA